MKAIIQYNKGDKFGDITFIQEDFHEKEVTGYQKVRRAVAECFCGRKFITRISGLKNGKVKSCGCTRRDGLLKRVTRHNLSESPEYTSWEGMKARCLNPNNWHYYNYGGRGIKVCERWLDFKNFYRDMGPKPSKEYSLERTDNNGNYCLENCKWTTRNVQNRNRRNNVYFDYEGEKVVMTDLVRRFNINYQTLQDRLAQGISLEDALTKKYKYVKSGKYAKS